MYIIGTVGVNTRDKKILHGMIESGVNVIRLNSSHGSQEEFNKVLLDIREYKKNVHILQDLTGGKIRVSKKIKNVIRVVDKEEIIFCGEDIYNNFVSSKKVIPVNISNKVLLNSNIEKISMKDNTMRFKIKSKSKNGIIVEVIRGGVVRGDKGCNFKGINRKSILSNKDKRDLDWSINNSVDIVCQSFVESKEDIYNILRYINKRNHKFKPKIWAKIESSNGVKNILEIIKIVDGIVIGRGDLVPETSLIMTPILQEKIIKIAKENNKDIVLGTHIFDSMKNGRDPDLAEVESIYNNIKKGVNGFLLAGETSVGKKPLETVRFLNTLIRRYI